MKKFKDNKQKVGILVVLSIITVFILFKELSLSEATSVIAVIIAGISVKVALESNSSQQKNIEKSNKYQRNTFELQNTILQNNTIIELGSQIIANIDIQNQNLEISYQKTQVRNYHWWYYNQNNFDMNSKETYDRLSNDIDVLYSENKTLATELEAKLTALGILLEGSIYLEKFCEIGQSINIFLTELKHEVGQLSLEEVSTFPRFEDFNTHEEESLQRLHELKSGLQNIFIELKRDEQEKLAKIINE